MPIAFAQGKTLAQTTSVSTAGVVFTSNTVTGNTVVAIYSTRTNLGTTLTSVTDSQSNTYRKAFRFQGGTVTIEVWYASNITGGTTPTVTFNTSGANTFLLATREYSGVAVPNSFDRGTGVSVTVGTTAFSITDTLSTQQANEVVIIVAHGLGANTFSAGSGYGNIQTVQDVSNLSTLGAEDQVVSARGIQSGTITSSTSTTGGVVLVSFADTAIKAPTTINNYQFVTAGNGMSTSEKIR